MSKRMISIMDDDSICKMFVRKQFESSEYKTETNESDNDSLAFESLMSNLSQSEFLPYVIFLNIFMPKMTGWQFLEKLEPFSRSIANIPQIHVPSRSHINDFAKKKQRTTLWQLALSKPIKLRQIQRIIHEVLLTN